jgi:hypothetical protein
MTTGTGAPAPMFESVPVADLPKREGPGHREPSAEDLALGTALAAALTETSAIRSTAEFKDRKSAETVVRKLARLANTARGTDAKGFVRQRVIPDGKNDTFRWVLTLGDAPKARAPKTAEVAK